MRRLAVLAACATLVFAAVSAEAASPRCGTQVSVTARRLTVAMKDAKAQPAREATGYACPSLVLTAR